MTFPFPHAVPSYRMLILPVAPAVVCAVQEVELLPKVVGFGEQATVTGGVVFSIGMIST